MTKHTTREKEVMIHCQKKYSGIRLWRIDAGSAYAKFSVKDALQEYKKTRSITQAMKKLVIVIYGIEGFPDIFGIYKGIFVGIEIKVGKDRQRKSQAVMEKVINRAGGIYILLDDKSSIDSQLKPIDRIKEWAQEKK